MTVGWNWRKRWELKLMMKCHCTCSSEIRTCIINEAARKKNTTKIHGFGVEPRHTTLYTHVLKVYINFQHKTNLKKKQPKSTILYLRKNHSESNLKLTCGKEYIFTNSRSCRVAMSKDAFVCCSLCTFS